MNGITELILLVLVNLSLSAHQQGCDKWEFLDPFQGRCVPCSLCTGGSKPKPNRYCSRNPVANCNGGDAYGCPKLNDSFTCTKIPNRLTYTVGTTCNRTCNGRPIKTTCTYRKGGNASWDASLIDQCPNETGVKSVTIAGPKDSNSTSIGTMGLLTITITVVVVVVFLVALGTGSLILYRRQPRISCVIWLKRKLEQRRRGHNFPAQEEGQEEIPLEVRPSSTTPASSLSSTSPISETSIDPQSSGNYSQWTVGLGDSTDVPTTETRDGEQSPMLREGCEHSHYNDNISEHVASVHRTPEAVERDDRSDTGIVSDGDRQQTFPKNGLYHNLLRESREPQENAESPSVTESDTSGVYTGGSSISNRTSSQDIQPLLDIVHNLPGAGQMPQQAVTTPLLEHARGVNSAPGLYSVREIDENSFNSVGLSGLPDMNLEHSDPNNQQTYMKLSFCSSYEDIHGPLPVATETVDLGSECSLEVSAADS